MNSSSSVELPKAAKVTVSSSFWKIGAAPLAGKAELSVLDPQGCTA